LAKDNENIPFFDDLPSRPTEPSGFSHEQMVRCDECLRANPPTRVDCLYCGLALPVSEASVALAKPSLRPLESWEQGYNSILLRSRNGEPSEELLNQVASLLRLELSAIQRVLSAKSNLPVARTSTPVEAALIERRLSDLRLETITVPDQELQIETAPPRRLRRLELRETDFVAYQTLSTEGAPIDWAEISLVIVGRLFVKQVELHERKTRKRENEILDASEVTSDEAVVDIYVGKRPESWRISASSFDFSCLGRNKSLLAGENFPRLIELIREHAPNAEFNHSYKAVRQCLEMVWPAQKRIESGGLKARGAKISTSEIITTNSEPQFTRYSRLCHYLKRNSLAQP
jgi:hypothetical protein